MKKNTANLSNIREQFQRETGLSKNSIREIQEAFPISNIGRVMLGQREFSFSLTPSGRAKKNSFVEEK